MQTCDLCINSKDIIESKRPEDAEFSISCNPVRLLVGCGMLAILSPAKTLDYDSPVAADLHTKPDFLREASELIRELRKLSEGELAALMSISPKLAALNWERIRAWKPPFTLDNARPALFAFKGEVYRGFDLNAFDRADFEYAQKHLRVLSGLYGVLRPMDLMQPYRLEMGTDLITKRGRNLYEFWGQQIAEALNAAVEQSGTDLLVNLASKEYFQAVDLDRLRARVVTPVFKDGKPGKYRVLALFAKQARGTMSDYLIRERVRTIRKIREFRGMGYVWNEELSQGDELVFTRERG